MTSLLREARDAHGWTLDQAASRLIRLASCRNFSISASQASLRQMLSDMERGRRKPGHYAPLLCELYGRTKAELGFEDLTEALNQDGRSNELIARIDRSLAVGKEAIAALQQQVDGVRLLDRQLGSPSVIETTKGLVTTLKNLVEHSFRPESRRNIAAILADAAALNAWQALNSGDLQEAWRLHELAKVAAKESESAALLAHAMGEQAYVLLDLNCPKEAVDLILAAKSVAARKVPSLLQTWLNAAEAEAYAFQQDRKSCHASLERAIHVLPDDTNNSEVPYISLNEWHLARWKGNILAKIGDPQAVKELDFALNQTDPSFVRATSSLECDMGEALLAQHRPKEAILHLERAHKLASATGSIRQLRRIQRARKRIE